MQKIVPIQRLRVHCFWEDRGQIKPGGKDGAEPFSRTRLVSQAAVGLWHSLARNKSLGSELLHLRSEPEIKRRVVIRLENFIALVNTRPADRDFIAACVSEALQSFDKTTHDHQPRVTILVKEVAERLGLPRSEQEDLRIAAMFHDLGKLGVPLEVLNKTGRLTAEEERFKPMHLLIALAVLEQIDSMRGVAKIVRCNHYYNGYPEGIQSEDIPLSGQIISASDYLDALTNRRPYQKPRTHPIGRALKKLEKRMERQDVRTPYDPRVVSALREIALSSKRPS